MRFEFREVPMSSRKSKVGATKARGQNELRLRTPGAPDFEPSIERLLEVAGIASTADARSSLDSHLHLAWGDHSLSLLKKERASKELFR